MTFASRFDVLNIKAICFVVTSINHLSVYGVSRQAFPFLVLYPINETLSFVLIHS